MVVVIILNILAHGSISFAKKDTAGFGTPFDCAAENRRSAQGYSTTNRVPTIR